MNTIQPINKNALRIATISFLLGTMLLLLFLIFGSNVLLQIGFCYVLIASVLNGITLIGLLANSIINHQYYKENLTTILLVLLNIPITLGYISIIAGNQYQYI